MAATWGASRPRRTISWCGCRGMTRTTRSRRAAIRKRSRRAARASGSGVTTRESRSTSIRATGRVWSWGGCFSEYERPKWILSFATASHTFTIFATVAICQRSGSMVAYTRSDGWRRWGLTYLRPVVTTGAMKPIDRRASICMSIFAFVTTTRWNTAPSKRDGSKHRFSSR